IFDPIVAVFIAVLIAKMGYDILKESSDVLCDASVISYKSIRERVMRIPGVLSCHKIRTRGRDEVYVDLHVEVDPKLSVEEGHGISTMVENRLKEEFKMVKEVIVHIEPLE
ncbi:MAG: cation diffusion facilitator family transporter, partial [Candidatus Altiarchaeota archaeon]|nr:cation diffusion facilitator family transporter [Candidatus Altiarchaeota archaeon]